MCRGLRSSSERKELSAGKERGRESPIAQTYRVNQSDEDSLLATPAHTRALLHTHICSPAHTHALLYILTDSHNTPPHPPSINYFMHSGLQHVEGVAQSLGAHGHLKCDIVRQIVCFWCICLLHFPSCSWP